MHRFVLPGTLLCLFAAPIWAGDAAYQACVDRTSNNGAWAQCGGAYLQRADRALNAAWRRTLALAKGKTRDDLLAEQRAWVAYKEASCAFHQHGDWGREGEVLNFFSCRGEVLQQRTKELQGIGQFLGQ